MKDKEYRNLSQETAKCDKMDDKELNLCAILKGHEGEVFWHYGVGEVKLTSVESNRLNFYMAKYDCIFHVASNGTSDNYPEAYSDIVLFPSKNQRNWQKWQEKQKPKYEMQGGFSVFKDGKPHADFYIPTLSFESFELAQQAAEAVKKTLEQFHKQNQQ